MPPLHFLFHLYNRSTLKLEIYDDFLVERNYDKLSAKFIIGTSMVIEKARLSSYFLFLVRTTVLGERE